MFLRSGPVVAERSMNGVGIVRVTIRTFFAERRTFHRQIPPYRVFRENSIGNVRLEAGSLLRIHHRKGFRRVGMADDAAFVQNRLNFLQIREPDGIAVRVVILRIIVHPQVGLNGRHALFHCHCGGSRNGRRDIFVLVTADAGEGFVRHQRRPRPHGLDHRAIFIQKLEVQRRIRGSREQRTAVFLHRNHAENLLDVPRAVAGRNRRERVGRTGAARNGRTDRGGTEFQFHHAEILRGTDGHPFHRGTFVNVGNVERAGFRSVVHHARTGEQVTRIHRNDLGRTASAGCFDQFDFGIRVAVIRIDREIRIHAAVTLDGGVQEQVFREGIRVLVLLSILPERVVAAQLLRAVLKDEIHGVIAVPSG